MTLFQSSVAQCVYSCPQCQTGDVVLTIGDSSGQTSLGSDSWIVEASDECTVPVDYVDIEWNWIPDSTNVPEPMPVDSGINSSFTFIGGPDDFEFQVNWQCPIDGSETKNPVLAVLLAYDDQDNILWQDNLLLRTVRCEPSLISQVSIETYFDELLCSVTAVSQSNIILQPLSASQNLNDFLTASGDPTQCSDYTIAYTLSDGVTSVDPSCLNYEPITNTITAIFPDDSCANGTVFFAKLCEGDVCAPIFKIKYNQCTFNPWGLAFSKYQAYYGCP